MPIEQKKPDKEVTLSNFYSGLITIHHLPQDLYFYNADKLLNAVKQSFPDVHFKYNSPDYKLYESIHDHVYLFSGAKTFQQTLAMSEAMIGEGGKLVSFDEFKELAGDIFEQYNENWLRTEYETAKDAGRMASKWLDFQHNKAALPYLTYQTEKDETVCEICAPLDGITLPVDDPFWSQNYPPLHFNCHCDVEQTDVEEDVSDDSEVEDVLQRHAEAKETKFKNNVGKTGQVFSNNHPYFNVPKKYLNLAKQNFGLPIPPIR